MSTTAARGGDRPGPLGSQWRRTGLPDAGPTGRGFPPPSRRHRHHKLGTELGLIVGLEAASGRDALITAVQRATKFRRFKAADVRSILEAGPGVPTVAAEGHEIGGDLPTVPTRTLDAYRLEDLG